MRIFFLNKAIVQWAGWRAAAALKCEAFINAVAFSGLYACFADALRNITTLS